MEPAASTIQSHRKSSDFFPIVFALAAAILAAVAALHTVHTLRRLSERYALYDFVWYYRWGQNYQSGIEWWARSHCNYTPFFVGAFASLTRIDAPSLHLGWQIFQVACLI